MKRETIKITKTMATSLAKHLLGKVEFIERNYMGYVFHAGVVEIEIEDKSKGYERELHDFFDNDLETKLPYTEPCYKVWWHVPGLNEQKVAYYKMNENYESIVYTYKPDEE